MNPLTDFIFTVSWFALLVFAVRSIVKGFASKPVRNYNAGTWTTEVTRRVHPEMEGVEPGEQLMGVTFDRKTECDLEEYRDLQARIDELRRELGGDDEEEDDDDGGDVVISRA